MVLITINWLFLVFEYDNPCIKVSIFLVGRIPLPMATNSSVIIRNANQYSFKLAIVRYTVAALCM